MDDDFAESIAELGGPAFCFSERRNHQPIIPNRQDKIIPLREDTIRSYPQGRGAG